MPLEDSSSEQVRVRFLNNLNREYYVQLAPLQRPRPVSGTDQSCATEVLESKGRSQFEIAMAREREIFLRAALQLLDQQDSMTHNKSKHRHHHGGSAHSHHHNNLPNSNLSSLSAANTSSNNTGGIKHQQQQQQQDDNTRFDVIRLGFLKKARNANVVLNAHQHGSSGNLSSLSGGLLNTNSKDSASWKAKYVEIRHGVFSYDDVLPGQNSTCIEDLTTTDQSNLATRRNLLLTADSVLCREVDHTDGCVFELTVAGGPRRAWMAASAEECKAWISAIRCAILGSNWEDSNYNSQYNMLSTISAHDGSDTDSRSHSRQDESAISFASGSGSGNPGVGHMDGTHSRKTTRDNRDSRWLSIDGAAAPYARDMSRFLYLQSKLNTPDINEREYRLLLKSFCGRKQLLTIPVLFIKSKTTHSNFLLSPQDSLSTQNISAKCNSQVWKDLQRDLIVVNGDRVSGECGAEAMVGALVRHISDKAEEIKASQDKSGYCKLGAAGVSRAYSGHDGHHLGNSHMLQSTTQTLSAALQATKTKLFSPQPNQKSSVSNFIGSQNNGNGHPPQAVYLTEDGEQKTPFHTPFAVTEAQIVQCARDLLVLCNRTQSGGDTYYCVDALLNGDKQRGLTILTPFSPEAEPLHFSVDIVQIQQFQNHSASSFSPERKKPSDVAHSLSHSNSFLQPHQRFPKAMPSSSTIKSSGLKKEYAGRSKDLSDLDCEADHSAPATPVVENTALLNSHGSELGNSHVVPIEPFSPPGRRPQLDLITELEKDGFVLGVALRNKPHPNVATPTGSLISNSFGMEDHDVDDSRDVTLTHPFADRRTNSVLTHSSGADGTTQSTVPMNSSNLGHQLDFTHDPLQQHNNNSSGDATDPMNLYVERVDDCSVVSELTWDTQLRTVYKPPGDNFMAASRQTPIDNNALAKEANMLSIATDGDHHMHSGVDDEVDHYDEEEVASTHSSSKPASKSKSLFKKLGKKLHKPFKIPESFEGFTSPFKPLRRDGFDMDEEPRSRKNSEAPAPTPAPTYSTEYPQSLGLHFDDINRLCGQARPVQTCCVRIHVTAYSKYRLCTSNPSGIDELDNWATLSGTFSQSFYIVGDGSGLLGIADRLVTIAVDSASLPSPNCA